MSFSDRLETAVTTPERSSWMRTFDEFERKTMMAFELQPQEGITAFLPGKGWGTEIAIQYPVYQQTPEGLVERKKNPACFEARGYRSHSDFEMYGMQPGSPESHYTPEFRQAFGAPEYFEATKMDEDVSRDELWHNTEVTVLPNGRKITTLSVEYLLAEKLMEYPKFEKANNHGRDISDAGALALTFDDIDREKVKEIYTKHLIDYRIRKLEEEKDRPNEEILGGARSAEEFITAERPSPLGRPRPSRLDEMIRKMEQNSSSYDSLFRFSMDQHVGLLEQRDYEPLRVINNDPQSWVGGKVPEGMEHGKLTEEAKQAIKESMIKSTQGTLKNRGEVAQERILNLKHSVSNIDLFFAAVDHRKRELEQQDIMTRKSGKPKTDEQSSVGSSATSRIGIGNYLNLSGGR